MYVLIAVAAAFTFACSSVLKHRSARAIATEPGGQHRRLRTLARQTVRHRTWLLAIAVDVVAIGLQIIALHAGPLSVVQPVLGVSLIFALALTARARLETHVWVWCLVLVVSVAAVSRLVAAPAGAAVDFLPSVALAAVVVAVAASCVALAARSGASTRRAVALGAGVGVLYAVNAALLKSIAALATAHGLIGVVTSWQLYVVIVSGATGLLLNQAAFQAGPLQQALPAMAAADPLTSIVVGVVVFDEPLVGGTLGVVALSLTALVLLVATMRLAARAVVPGEAAGTVGPNRLAGCAS